MSSLTNLIDNLAKNKLVRQAVQVREIVPIQHWLESPFYIGMDGAKGLYDRWKEEITKIFEGKKSEVILTGSLGSGKSTVGDYCLLRKLYELSCHEPMPFLFNMMESTIIAFLYFSVTLKQAEITGFGKFRRIIDEIPYFQRFFPRNRLKNSTLEFKNLHVMYGSEIGHQLGLDLCGSVLDEANFLGKDHRHVEEYDKATVLYTSITNRRLNRFVIEQEDKGLSIVISSASDPSAFVESRIREAEKEDSIHVANVVSYEVKRKQYSKEEFCVFIGTDVLDPMIIENNDDLKKVLVGLGYDIDTLDWRLNFEPIIKRHLPSYVNGRFKFVPETFRRLFAQDIQQAIMDITGTAITPDIKLFKNRELYRVACEGMTNLFYQDTVTLTDKDEIPLSEYFTYKIKTPPLARFIHVDQAVVREKETQKVKNRLALACSHVSKYQKTVGPGGEVLPYVEVDFIITVNPPERPAELPLWKVRQFIIWLRDQGLNIGLVTFDQFQSRDNIQMLRANNIEADNYSVDKDDSDWLSLVRLYYERRIKHPHHSIYNEELFSLEHDRNKHRVDHPTGAYKDASDAICGSIANALNRTSVAAYNLGQFAIHEDVKQSEQAKLYDMIKKGKLPIY